MKQSLKKIIVIMPVIGICMITTAQNKQITKTDFAVLKTGSVAFKPVTIKDVTGDASKTENDLITLPNNKKVKLGDYLKAVNTIEKNLADIGYDKKQLQGTTVIAAYKPKLPVTTPKILSTTSVKALAAPVVQQRFKLNSALNTTGLTLLKNAKLISKTTQEINRDETPDPFSFTVGDYNVKLAPSFTMSGKTEYMEFTNDNQRNIDTLTKFAKTKNNQYSLGLGIDISTNIPVLGNVTVYSLQSKFDARSSKDSSLRSNVKLKVFEQVLVSENKTIHADTYSYTESKDYNINKLIGSADIFMYGLNLFSPVNFYMTGKVGGSFDVDISRLGITGQMGPNVAQSIILESSVFDAVGLGFLQGNIVDAGVGGELKLIQGTLEFGGSTGVTASGKKIKLLNDVYNSFDLDLLQGRLYTYYSYPAYLCSSIFQAGDANCYGIRRIENNLFSTNAALQFNIALVDDNKGADLGW